MGTTESWRPLCPAYPDLRAAGLLAHTLAACFLERSLPARPAR